MNRSSHPCFLCFFIFLAVLPVLIEPTASGQGIQKEDEIQLREFDNQTLGELKEDPRFDYSIQRGKGTTIWQRIISWLMAFINQLLYGDGSSMVIRTIIYILIIGAVIFSILKFLNADPSTLFGKSKSKVIPYSVAEENIHEIDFDKEIEMAVENHDYKLAVRLYYLRILKAMADKAMLDWEPGKTNSDYFYEIKSGELRSSFVSLGRMFEYAWYGGFEIERPVLEKARELYKDISSRL